ncbi:hypothetical protein JMJ35_007168 [Cladonia borealis]|uniref:FAD-binding PCMH-type domain-containing protein n=1 Tax=Cladonia borealis TaxID=184061 RepID=A0AA39QYE2_9LECA|nr:hypothetical protein JMJ35_007168 [Cladonia borealis]
MKYIYTAVSLLLISIASAANGTIRSELLSLGLSSGSQIGPTSEYTQRWSSYDAPSYVTAVKPATEDDVAKIIAYAIKFSIPFLSIGGGHGFSITLGTLHNGIELDLSNFDTVSVDVQSSTLTIGGAVRFRDILGPLGQAHKEIPIGSESCVGMVDATLGGGSQQPGTSSQLLQRRTRISSGAFVVLASILEVTYSVYNETAPQVLHADFLSAFNASQRILEYFKSFESSLPAELPFILLAAYSSDFGGSSIIVNAVYAGPQAEGEKYLYTLFKFSPIQHNLTMIFWSEINAASFFGTEPSNYTCPTDSPHNVYGGAVYQFDIDTFQEFYENYEQLTSSMPVELNGTVYFIEFFPKQAVETVPSNATVYAWRNTTAHLLFNFAYIDTEGALDNRINEFATAARSNFTSVSGFPQPELYNYPITF